MSTRPAKSAPAVFARLDVPQAAHMNTAAIATLATHNRIVGDMARSRTTRLSGHADNPSSPQVSPLSTQPSPHTRGGIEPLHVPLLHTSLTVHALPSLQEFVLLLVCTHCAEDASQESVLQTLLLLHSPCVVFWAQLHPSRFAFTAARIPHKRAI
jgi:hypothetical protein